MEAQKEMIARMVRYGLLFVSGWLVSEGLIDQEFADQWLSETTAMIVGFVLVMVPVVWGYLKARFDRRVVEVAVQLPPPPADTPAEVVAAVNEAKAVVKADSTTTVPY